MITECRAVTSLLRHAWETRLRISTLLLGLLASFGASLFTYAEVQIHHATLVGHGVTINPTQYPEVLECSERCSCDAVNQPPIWLRERRD